MLAPQPHFSTRNLALNGLGRRMGENGGQRAFMGGSCVLVILRCWYSSKMGMSDGSTQHGSPHIIEMRGVADPRCRRAKYKVKTKLYLRTCMPTVPASRFENSGRVRGAARHPRVQVRRRCRYDDAPLLGLAGPPLENPATAPANPGSPALPGSQGSPGGSASRGRQRNRRARPGEAARCSAICGTRVRVLLPATADRNMIAHPLADSKPLSAGSAAMQGSLSSLGSLSDRGSGSSGPQRRRQRRNSGGSAAAGTRSRTSSSPSPDGDLDSTTSLPRPSDASDTESDSSSAAEEPMEGRGRRGGRRGRGRPPRSVRGRGRSAGRGRGRRAPQPGQDLLPPLGPDDPDDIYSTCRFDPLLG